MHSIKETRNFIPKRLEPLLDAARRRIISPPIHKSLKNMFHPEKYIRDNNVYEEFERNEKWKVGERRESG